MASPTKNYSGAGMASGCLKPEVSKQMAPSGEGKDACKSGSGGGQTSGKVQHRRSKNNIENMNGMPKVHG